MKFRPCAVNGVSVDYTGAGVPSFFKNGAPTVINLTLQLTEIQLWDQTNYTGGESTLESLNPADAEKLKKAIEETPLTPNPDTPSGLPPYTTNGA